MIIMLRKQTQYKNTMTSIYVLWSQLHSICILYVHRWKSRGLYKNIIVVVYRTIDNIFDCTFLYFSNILKWASNLIIARTFFKSKNHPSKTPEMYWYNPSKLLAAFSKIIQLRQDKIPDACWKWKEKRFTCFLVWCLRMIDERYPRKFLPSVFAGQLSLADQHSGLLNVVWLQNVVLTFTQGVVMWGVVCALIVLTDPHSNWLNTERICSFVMESDSDGISHLCPNDRT